MLGDNYIIQAGEATHTEIWSSLLLLVCNALLPSDPESFALDMGSIMPHFIFNEPIEYPHLTAFFNENRERFRSEVRKPYLSSPEMKELLSGAAFNIGYGRYVATGGGRLMNRFLGLLRYENAARTYADQEAIARARAELDRRSEAILRPITSLKNLGLWRARPHSPNERAYFEAVRAFGERVQNESARSRKKQAQEETSANIVGPSASAFDTSDYGTAEVAPSEEAQSVRDQMNPTDGSCFDEILARFQNWQDKKAGGHGVRFHPETLSCLWGLAFSKISDSYLDSGDTQKAFFYMSAGWQCSKYPLFANNAALLCIALGNNSKAREFLGEFLQNYRAVRQNEIFGMVMGQAVSSTELERLAASARSRVAAIEAGGNPMTVR